MITSATYLDAKGTRTEFVDDGVTVQELGGGARSQRVLDWIAAGNKPSPFVPPPNIISPTSNVTEMIKTVLEGVALASKTQLDTLYPPPTPVNIGLTIEPVLSAEIVSGG